MPLPEGVKLNGEYNNRESISLQNPRYILENCDTAYWYVPPEERDEKYYAYLREGEITGKAAIACQVSLEACERQAGHVWATIDGGEDELSFGLHPTIGDIAYFQEVMTDVLLLRKKIAHGGYPDATAAMKKYFKNPEATPDQLLKIIGNMTAVIKKHAATIKDEEISSKLNDIADRLWVFSGFAHGLINRKLGAPADENITKVSLMEALQASVNELGEWLIKAMRPGKDINLFRSFGGWFFGQIAATFPRDAITTREDQDLKYDVKVEFPITAAQQAIARADAEQEISGHGSKNKYHLFGYNGGENCVTCLIGKRGLFTRIGLDVSNLIGAKDPDSHFVQSPTSFYKDIKALLDVQHGSRDCSDSASHQYRCNTGNIILNVTENTYGTATFPFLHNMASLLQDGWLGVLAERSGHQKVAKRA